MNLASDSQPGPSSQPGPPAAAVGQRTVPVDYSEGTNEDITLESDSQTVRTAKAPASTGEYGNKRKEIEKRHRVQPLTEMEWNVENLIRPPEEKSFLPNGQPLLDSNGKQVCILFIQILLYVF